MKRLLSLLFTVALALIAFVSVQPSDVDGVATVASLVSYVAIGVIALAFALLARKQLMPYVKLEEFIRRAAETPLSSAIVVLAICHLMTSLIGLFGGQIR